MNKFVKKKISIMLIGIISVLVVIGAGVGLYMNTPSNMIALDINPSIELHTNRLNRVVSINPVNEDAIKLMTGYNLEDQDLETVIEDIVDRMILGGYLTKNNENQILITVDDSNTSKDLLDRANAVITTYLLEKQMKVQLFQQSLLVTKEEEEVAHENNVSAGKMAIVDKLFENSTSLSIEEFANASIKELIQFSIDQNISLEDLIENYLEVLEDQIDLEDLANTDDNQIDALSSATVKVEASVLASDVEVSNKDVEIDAISSATVKTEASVSGNGETEDMDDFDREDNDYEDYDDDDDDIDDQDDSDDDNDDQDDDDQDSDDQDDDDQDNDDQDNDDQDDDDQDNDDQDNDDQDNDDEDNDDQDNDDEDNDDQDNDDQDDDDEDNDDQD